MNSYIKFPCILLAVGFCNSGKSVAVRYTIKTAKEFDFIVVISNTAEFNGDYEFLKEVKGVGHRIYNGSKCNEILEMLMNIQEKNHKEGKKFRLAIVLDDVMGSLNTSDIFKRLTSTYRHFSITLMITTQFCNNSTTYIRELANYIYCFDQRTEQSKKAIYSSYFSDVGTFSDFKRLFAGLKPYQFFFIDRVKKQRFKMICPYDGPKVEDTPPPPQPPKKDEKKEFIAAFDKK